MRPLGVLRISHSSVAAEWRRRERCLTALGASVTLVTAKKWQKGGGEVKLDISPDEKVLGLATFGHHPCGFAYDPVGLWRALRSAPYDVLDVHEEPYSLAATEVLLLRWLVRRRSPLVFYSAQNLPKRHALPVRLAERGVLATAKGAYPCNEAAAANLRRKGFRGAVATIPLGVDPPKSTRTAFATTGTTTDEGGLAALRIGCAGRLGAEKGFDLAIEAVAPEPRWLLTIAGEGPERSRLEDLARRLGASRRVQFLGHCREMDRFYSGIDVLVVPSVPVHGLQEQFGRVVAEAMAAGVPVVSSTCGSLPEVVGDAGLTVGPGDVEGLRLALARLDKDPSLRRDLARKGRERARMYSWESVAARQLGLYRFILSVPGSAQPADDDGTRDLPPPEVVVVAYGHPEMLKESLAALLTKEKLATPGPGDAARAIPVVVVDNSSDALVRDVAQTYGARYIDPGSNLGFAAAVNLALRRACRGGSDILLLNPDARVSPATVLALQHRLHAESRLACVAPAQAAPDGQEQRVAWPFPTPLKAWVQALGLGRLLRRQDFLTGSVLLLNGAALEEVGYFDEYFFLYAEETDWQRRAKAQGWGVRLCRDLRAMHIGGGTSIETPLRRELLFAAAQERYLRKWHGKAGWQVARAALVTGALARAVLLSGPRRKAAFERGKRFALGPLRLAEGFRTVP